MRCCKSVFACSCCIKAIDSFTGSRTATSPTASSNRNNQKTNKNCCDVIFSPILSAFGGIASTVLLHSASRKCHLNGEVSKRTKRPSDNWHCLGKQPHAGAVSTAAFSHVFAAANMITWLVLCQGALCTIVINLCNMPSQRCWLAFAFKVQCPYFLLK